MLFDLLAGRRLRAAVAFGDAALGMLWHLAADVDRPPARTARPGPGQAGTALAGTALAGTALAGAPLAGASRAAAPRPGAVWPGPAGMHARGPAEPPAAGGRAWMHAAAAVLTLTMAALTAAWLAAAGMFLRGGSFGVPAGRHAKR
jgi:hypothetical protein